MRQLREEAGKIIFAAVVLVDQTFKLIFLKSGFFSINEGVSFGLFSSFHFLVILAINILSLVFLFKFPRVLGLWLMAAGGVSNLVDRIFRQGVIDFNFFSPISLNFADLAICLGGILILIDLVKTKKI